MVRFPLSALALLLGLPALSFGQYPLMNTANQPYVANANTAPLVTPAQLYQPAPFVTTVVNSPFLLPPAQVGPVVSVSLSGLPIQGGTVGTVSQGTAQLKAGQYRLTVQGHVQPAGQQTGTQQNHRQQNSRQQTHAQQNHRQQNHRQTQMQNKQKQHTAHASQRHGSQPQPIHNGVE